MEKCYLCSDKTFFIMAHKAKKLVSVRLEADDIQVIDDWIANGSYYGRTDVIEAAVRLAAWCIETGNIQKLMRFWPRFDTVDEFKLEYHRQR